MCIYISLYICVYIWFSLVSSAGKEFTCNAGDPGLIPGSGRSSREGMGYPFQYSWASLVAQLGKNPPPMWDTWARSLGWKDPLEREWLPTQYSCLENSMDYTVHGVAKSWTRLSNFHFHVYIHVFMCYMYVYHVSVYYIYTYVCYVYVYHVCYDYTYVCVYV